MTTDQTTAAAPIQAPDAVIEALANAIYWCDSAPPLNARTVPSRWSIYQAQARNIVWPAVRDALLAHPEALRALAGDPDVTALDRLCHHFERSDAVERAWGAHYAAMVVRGRLEVEDAPSGPSGLRPPRSATGAAAALDHAVRLRPATPGRPEDGPYPTSVGEVADEVVAWIRDHEQHAAGLVGQVRDRLAKEAAREISADELPGMWERADFEGGAPDAYRPPVREIPADELAKTIALMRISESVTLTGPALANVLDALDERGRELAKLRAELELANQIMREQGGQLSEAERDDYDAWCAGRDGA